MLLILCWILNCSIHGIMRHHSHSIWLIIWLGRISIWPGVKLLDWSLLVLIAITWIIHWCLAISSLSSVSSMCSVTRSTSTLGLHSILLATSPRIRMLILLSSLELLLRISRLWGCILSLIASDCLRMFWNKLLLLIMSIRLFYGGWLTGLFKLLKKFCKSKRRSSYCSLLRLIFMNPLHASYFSLLRLLLINGCKNFPSHSWSHLSSNLSHPLGKDSSIATSSKLWMNNTWRLFVHLIST
jgi:hypothetical protein